MQVASRPVLRFPKARKGSALYEELRGRIVRGDLRSEAPITEIHLARAYGCSQGTVREALMRLQEDGLVVRNGYRGTVVSATSPAEIREMQALRLRLELQGARLAAPAVDEDLVAQLSDVVRAMEAAAEAGDAYQVTEHDCEFHLAIFGRAGLPALEPILSRCLLHLHRSALAERGRTRPLAVSAARHWPVVEALATRDPARATAALDHHIATVLEYGFGDDR